jgi:hypothetical protein
MQRHVQGKLSLVQEQRFQLIDENGVAHLFIVAPGVSLKPSDLRTILHLQQRVRVKYEESPPLIAHVATSIELAKPLQETV